MKYKSILLLLILSLFICPACTSVEFNKSISVSGFDFRSYSEREFVILPSDYMGTYLTQADLNFYFFPAVQSYVSADDRNEVNSIYKHGGQNFYIMKISSNTVLDSLYSYSLRMGANGISNFKVQEVISNEHGIDLVGIHVTGLAIKRIE